MKNLFKPKGTKFIDYNDLEDTQDMYNIEEENDNLTLDIYNSNKLDSIRMHDIKNNLEKSDRNELLILMKVTIIQNLLLNLMLRHMGSAVLKALSLNFNEEKTIYILNRTFEKSKRLAKEYNAIAIENLSDIKNLNIDAFVIGVRPIDCDQLFNELSTYDIENKLIISMV
ncbi:hypothetical protein FQA39_LY12905 [Lamprigera yunnana]|nr:hypothetical protein FQA39_LY12905 [Lamprigera yunnana]